MKRGIIVLGFVSSIALVLPEAPKVNAQADPYPAMAQLEEYLMPQDAEIALARSAAPASISDAATVMVLGRRGYTTAVQGKNGFLCYVERSWAQTVDNKEFWNPKLRSPNCFNEAAARSIALIYLKKTELVLAGKSKPEIAQGVASVLDSGQVPALPPGGMCYMMSKEQYLNDQSKSWHPHLMFYAAGDVAPNWGANLDGSPLVAVHDAESRVTVFMVVVRRWSDGTPAG